MALSPPPIQAPLNDPRGGLTNLQWAAWFREMWQAIRTGNVAGIGGVWGTLTGTLSDQTDLQVELNTKLDSSRQISTELPLTGGGFLTADLTLEVEVATVVSTGVVQVDGVTITVDPDGIISSTGAGANAATFADAEVPSGAINSINLVYTLANVPSPDSSVQIYLNGLLQAASGTDYTLSGSTVTFVTAPATGDSLLAYYRYTTTTVAVTFVDAEIPSGTIDSANTAYTLATAPSPVTSLMLYRNGVLQKAAGTDYTLAGTAITYGVAPLTGDSLLAYYRY